MENEGRKFSQTDHLAITEVTMAIAGALTLAQQEGLIKFPGAPDSDWDREQIESKLFVCVRFMIESIEKRATQFGQ